DAGVSLIPAVEVWRESLGPWEDPWFSRFVPGYRTLSPTELPENTACGIAYQTISFNVPKFMRFLQTRFLQMGGRIEKRDVAHIDDIVGDHIDCVVNCSGIGARTLGGVMDMTVFPTRGQIVIVNAPRV
ncbi:hypothetical protein BDK51DRAFT_6290, partial [Blyttiomyces helicus]